MNLSTKIGTLVLASAMSLGVSTSTQAQTGGLAALGTTTGITAATAVAIGVIGAVAINSAGNDNFDAPLPRGDGQEPGGGSQSTFDTTSTE